MLARRLPLVLAGYVVLALAGAAWCWARARGGMSPFGDAFLEVAYPLRLGVSLGLSAVLAACSIAGTKALARGTRWGKALHAELRALAGPLGEGALIAWAVTSAASEELFFRGALQPAVGVVVGALVFGALHVGPFRRAWARSLWAVGTGLLLGGIVWLTGDLVGPIVAHAVINHRNLAFIEGTDLSGLAGSRADASAPPSLVGTRARRADYSSRASSS